MIYSAEAGLCV